MKKLLITLFASAISAVAMAQPAAGTFSVIPRVGVSLANLSGDAVCFGSDGKSSEWGASRNKAGVTIGADFDYQLSRSLSVMLGAQYTQQGCRYGNVSAQEGKMDAGKYVGLNNMSTQTHVINVPLLLNYYIAPGFAVKTGVQFGFPVSGKVKYTETQFSEADDGGFEAEKREKHDISLDKTMKSVDFAIPVGLSFEYMNVIIDARYNIGLTDVQKKMFDMKPVKNRVFMFSVAYRFEL